MERTTFQVDFYPTTAISVGLSLITYELILQGIP